MTQTTLPQSHEQRKIEQLLVKLSKMKPVSAKPAPIVQEITTIRTGGLARLFLDIAKGDSKRLDLKSPQYPSVGFLVFNAL
jgi:hypothetical protein